MKNTIYTTIGASNHSGTARKEHDFYATYPEAIDRLFEVEKFPDTIWEPACGMGHLSKRMIELGKKVHSTDLINRGYGTGGVDFLKATENPYGAVITNPPYKIALEFIEKALDISDEGTKIAMFLKLTFLEGKDVNHSSGTIHHEKSMSFLPALLLPRMEILQPSQTTEMQSPMPGSCGKKVIRERLLWIG